MGWYSNDELKDMKRRDLENQLRDLEREYNYAYNKRNSPGKYEDIDLLERVLARVSEKMRDINSQLNNL